VVNNHVALNGVNLPDEKAIDVQIACPNHEVFESDSLWVCHGWESKRQGLPTEAGIWVDSQTPCHSERTGPACKVFGNLDH
jgi:hypothetical protein